MFGCVTLRKYKKDRQNELAFIDFNNIVGRTVK